MTTTGTRATVRALAAHAIKNLIDDGALEGLPVPTVEQVSKNLLIIMNEFVDRESLQKLRNGEAILWSAHEMKMMFG